LNFLLRFGEINLHSINYFQTHSRDNIKTIIIYRALTKKYLYLFMKLFFNKSYLYNLASMTPFIIGMEKLYCCSTRGSGSTFKRESCTQFRRFSPSRKDFVCGQSI